MGSCDNFKRSYFQTKTTPLQGRSQDFQKGVLYMNSIDPSHRIWRQWCSQTKVNGGATKVTVVKDLVSNISLFTLFFKIEQSVL